MAISKIQFKSSSEATPVVWMDATSATAAASDITAPKTAMLANGVVTTGTGTGGDTRPLVAEKQVNFIDYEGTILYSYTEAEFDQVSELPANPSHTGLTAQGWNWTIDEIRKQLIQVPGGKIWVGQSYTTTSGATEVDIELDDPEYLSPYLRLLVSNGTVTIDWGDGSTVDTTTGTSSTNRMIQHVYSSIGRYTIKIKSESGTHMFYNTDGSNSISILYESSNINSYYRFPVYSNSIKAVRLSSDFRFRQGCFRCLSSCEYVTMPYDLTIVDQAGMFAQSNNIKALVLPKAMTALKGTLANNCYSLRRVSFPPHITIGSSESDQFSADRSISSITLPYGITSLPNNMFYQNLGANSIVIPNTATSIGNSGLSTLAVHSIVIPENVTSLGTNACRYNYSVKEYYFKPTTPPTLGDANTFGGIFSGCKIYVPSASVNTYKTASGWTNWANYIYAGEACTGISFNTNSITLAEAGDYGLIKATVTPSNTIDYIAWTSSNTSVATIANGVVTAVGVGTATITATCGSYSATCAVTVGG